MLNKNVIFRIQESTTFELDYYEIFALNNNNNDNKRTFQQKKQKTTTTTEELLGIINSKMVGEKKQY